MSQSILRACSWLILIVAMNGVRTLLAAELTAVPRVEFNRDIRSILSDKCFTCHGPDSAKRQAGLRLDMRESAVAERDGGTRAFAPGSSSSSESLRRVMSADPEEVMPPPNSGAKLSPREIDLLKRWLDDGAVYQPHWSFLAPRATVPPTTEQSAAARGPVDQFIRAQLDRERLFAAPEADRSTLLRRASFDLIGLSPSPEEVDAFVGDSSPDAFEKQIDRLLASPRYGERMATIWLDAARYADTNGYQTDGPRFMWRYRDWVIDAFNRNQPFDEFTIEQLAGDLLPRGSSAVPSPPSSEEKARVRGPSGGQTLPSLKAEERTPHPNPLPSKARGEGTGNAATAANALPTIANGRLIATGFNRNHRGNAEGGIIPEEFRVEYVVDRVETTSTVWLGLTIGCARCHDHKYDPISQREFYQLFAFFNQVPEPGKYIRNNNSMPYLPAPTADQQLKLTALEREADAARANWDAMVPAVKNGMTRLSAEIASGEKSVDWSFGVGLDSVIPFDGDGHVSRLVKPPVASEKVNVEDVEVPSFKTSDATWHDGPAQFTGGRIGQAAEFDGKRWLDAGDVGDFGEDESFAISCWVKPSGNKTMTILARMDHENASRGYELRIEESGRLQALFSGRILDDLIRVETKEPLATDRWSHLFVSYDGSSAARGVSIRVNGARAELTVIIDLLSNPIRVKLPLVIGAGGSAGPFEGAIDELRLYRGRLTDEVALSLAAGDSISQIASGKLGNIASPAHLAKLREFYLRHHAREAERGARQLVLDTRARYEAYLATIPTTMVMQDVPGLRETHILTRGEYNKPGEIVQAGLPAVLMAKAPTNRNDQSDQLRNRLGLAQWLVAPENPLTARVAVNRLWQMLFGNGLVKTSEDFGVQGDLPSHPELLDWLAVEFAGESRAESRESRAGKGESDSNEVALSSSGSRLSTLDSRLSFDIKRTLRQLVTSATYRQSSRIDEGMLARDPSNQWLARGPRFRLSAEMIRDAALASSGLLVESLGGPSVKPYQPPGLWEELSAETVPGPMSVYVQDHGASLYRRSLYTFQKRTVTTPGLALFDASSRDFCRVKLPRTNTPLQALNLMNDVTYLEAARVLAERTLQDGGTSAESRITWAFRHVLSRSPNDTELSALVRGFDRRRKGFQQQPTAALQALQAGESPVNSHFAPDELAALTATISVLFNVDEFVERP